jgi:hypothetical protein
MRGRELADDFERFTKAPDCFLRAFRRPITLAQVKPYLKTFMQVIFRPFVRQLLICGQTTLKSLDTLHEFAFAMAVEPSAIELFGQLQQIRSEVWGAVLP